MTDVPRTPLTGTATLAGKAPVPLAQGVTFELASSERNSGFKLSNKGVTAYPLSHTFTVPELQLNVMTAIGYVPYGVTVIGFSILSADLDSGSPALVQALYLGSALMVAGLTEGQGATSGFHPCVPTETTEPTVVYLKTTTAAATAVAGAVSVHAYYYST